jgi:hypothetical protein
VIFSIIKKFHYSGLKKEEEKVHNKDTLSSKRETRRRTTTKLFTQRKNTKKPKVTLYSLPELIKGSNIRKTIL